MIKKDKKKDKEQQEQWIEMDDLRAPQNQEMSLKFAQMEGKKYVPLSGSEGNLEYPDLQMPLFAKNESERNSSRESPDYKNTYSNSQQQHSSRKKVEPSLPMMEVICDFCTVAQRVPGNTQVYSCGSCQNMNECYPLYGIAVCGCCQVKLGFGFGMGAYIKCPKCSTVNKVPVQPVKNYESMPVLEEAVSSQIERRLRQRKGFEREKEREGVHSELEKAGFYERYQEKERDRF